MFLTTFTGFTGFSRLTLLLRFPFLAFAATGHATVVIEITTSVVLSLVATAVLNSVVVVAGRAGAAVVLPIATVLSFATVVVVPWLLIILLSLSFVVTGSIVATSVSTLAASVPM